MIVSLARTWLARPFGSAPARRAYVAVAGVGLVGRGADLGEVVWVYGLPWHFGNWLVG
jgi:hypothetical protein